MMDQCINNLDKINFFNPKEKKTVMLNILNTFSPRAQVDLFTLLGPRTFFLRYLSTISEVSGSGNRFGHILVSFFKSKMASKMAAKIMKKR